MGCQVELRLAVCQPLWPLIWSLGATLSVLREPCSIEDWTEDCFSYAKHDPLSSVWNDLWVLSQEYALNTVGCGPKNNPNQKQTIYLYLSDHIIPLLKVKVLLCFSVFGWKKKKERRKKRKNINNLILHILLWNVYKVSKGKLLDRQLDRLAWI